MLYSLHTLDQDTLKSELTTLIEAERDFTKPRYVALTRMLNELSVTGFPLLDEDRSKPHTWISPPLHPTSTRLKSPRDFKPAMSSSLKVKLAL